MRRNQNGFILGAAISLFVAALWVFLKTEPANVSAPASVSNSVSNTVSNTVPTSVPSESPALSKTIPVSTIKPEIAAFSKFLNKSYEGLVTSSQLEGAHAEHGTPKETYRDSEAFGRIMDEVKANPELVPLVMEFYEKCALNADVIAPTRSVCLAHFKYWAGKKAIVFDRHRYPADIVRTAEVLPVMWD